MYTAILLAAMSCSQCSGGVCTPPARTVERERSVVVKRTVVEPARKIVRERPVRRVLERVRFWR